MRIETWSIEAPVLTAAVIDHAKAAGRKEALEFTEARADTLVQCALFCEKYVGRALWPGSRAALSIVEISDTTERVPLLPGLPDSTGVTLRTAVVREWSDEREDWQTSTFKRRPGGTVLLPQTGEFELSVTVDAADTIPPEAVEAIARYWAWSDALKPGDLAEVTGEQQVLAGGMLKSGAAEALRSLRVHTVI